MVTTSSVGARTGNAEAHPPQQLHRRRLQRTRIKDVAGLVPGAYMGLGCGNAFLNDLLDADVLVHVLDGSGTTDRGGRRHLMSGCRCTLEVDYAKCVYVLVSR